MNNKDVCTRDGRVQRNLYLYLLNQPNYLSLKPYSNVLGLNWEQW